MNLGFIGNGGMSKAMQAIAQERQHNINCVAGSGDTWDFALSDVVCEVTVPAAFMENIQKLADQKKDILVVTTGWYDQIDEVKQIVEDAGIRFMYSSNYSIGVNLYFRMVEAAAKLMDKADEYDVWGHEIHHKNKADSPSGTAKILEKLLIKNIVRKTKIVEDKLDRRIKDHELHFSSVRGGLVNFEHTVGFDSAADSIQLKHFARNRDGYALGAIKAAEWLSAREPGFYTMEDYLSEIFS